MNSVSRWLRIVRAAGAAVCGLALGILAGCTGQSPTTQPTSMAQRQEQTLQNPFGYSPNMNQSDMSVSGHGEFDKEGFDRDKDFVLNP